MTRAEKLAVLLESGWAADTSPEEMLHAADELRRLNAEVEALRADAERLKRHAVTLANTVYVTTVEKCAAICETYYNHEAKDCADDIRELLESKHE